MYYVLNSAFASASREWGRVVDSIMRPRVQAGWIYKTNNNFRIIPNTAVFGPTNFIGTTIASTITALMKISDEDFG